MPHNFNYTHLAWQIQSISFDDFRVLRATYDCRRCQNFEHCRRCLFAAGHTLRWAFVFTCIGCLYLRYHKAARIDHWQSVWTKRKMSRCVYLWALLIHLTSKIFIIAHWNTLIILGDGCCCCCWQSIIIYIAKRLPVSVLVCILCSHTICWPYQRQGVLISLYSPFPTQIQ